MKKRLLQFVLVGLPLLSYGQITQPNSIDIGYFGEMITHPGLRVSVSYELKNWKKTKREKTITKSYQLNPSIGFYYHRRYQTGVFAIPTIEYQRKNEKGRIFKVGVGLGYLRTFIPNTFEVKNDGSVEKVAAGHHYLATNYYVAFGKDLQPKDLPFAYFIKPQIIYATPNFPSGVSYFALEIGIQYHLKNN